ncbi:MAG: hypothetical protein GY948_18335 [Alphaproteobacteria bacterium]|nr:hypothetical protein [Alphaproteobacteria bacterium]
MSETKTPSDQSHDQLAASIVVLLVLTSVMLFSLFTRTPPHPPLEIPLFALAPFFGASLAIGAAALWLVRRGSGTWLALLFAATALISFGPHKLFDPAFALIWPAVLLAQAAVIAVAYLSIGRLRRKADLASGAPSVQA